MTNCQLILALFVKFAPGIDIQALIDVVLRNFLLVKIDLVKFLFCIPLCRLVVLKRRRKSMKRNLGFHQTKLFKSKSLLVFNFNNATNIKRLPLY